jgi:hypothetical protein
MTTTTAKGKWLGPRQCWYCGKRLQGKLGGGYHFATVKDPLGNELRVHKDCVTHAVGNGYVEIKE